MTPERDDTLLPLIRRIAAGSAAGVADSELLRRFLNQRDEAAFELLVRRHGPMVLAVCRRVLGRLHDAEDAFQATFLVLARKAAEAAASRSVAAWLHGVASRTALKARTTAARWRRWTVIAREGPTSAAPTEPEADWQPLLDEELRRLPEKYRLPILFCLLEGQSRKDVAKRLAIPEGTLSSRLAAGRQMLADRLTRRGVTLPASALALTTTSTSASAIVPATLVMSTARAAGSGVVSASVAALSKGMLRSMFLAKMKSWSVAFAVLVILSGGGYVSYGTWAAPPQVTPTPPPDRRAEEPKKDAGPAKDDDLAALRRKKLDAAKAAWAILEELARAGKDPDIKMISSLSRMWLEAEREVNPGPAGRLAAAQEYLKRTKMVEEIIDIQVKAGRERRTPAELYMGQYHRIEAEIWVKEEAARQPR